MELLERIEKFYLENIHEKFYDSSYIFDVCLGKQTVKLMDFNPFGSVTDSLLYSWEEFESAELKLELRILEKNYGIFSNQYKVYSQPIESIESLQHIQTEELASLINKVNLFFN